MIKNNNVGKKITLLKRFFVYIDINMMRFQLLN